MSQLSTFSRKLQKYALRAKKMAESALRADSTLCPTLNTECTEMHNAH